MMERLRDEYGDQRQSSVSPDVSFFFSSRRRHTRLVSDWSSDVCSSDLASTSESTPQSTQANMPACGSCGARQSRGIGRGSGRGRGEISGGGVSLKKKKQST